MNKIIGSAVKNKIVGLEGLSKEELELIVNLGLYDRKKLVKFIVETFSKCFESISEDIQELKEMNLIDSISKIKTAQYIYNITDKNDNLLPGCLQALNEGMEQVIAKTQLYIQGITKIDKAPLWERAKSAFGTRLSVKVANYNVLARKSLDAVIVGMTFVEYAKSKELCNENYFNSVDNGLVELIDSLDSKKCMLLAEYAPKSEDYWLKIGTQLKTINTALIECNDVFDDIEIDDIEIEF